MLYSWECKELKEEDVKWPLQDVESPSFAAHC